MRFGTGLLLSYPKLSRHLPYSANNWAGLSHANKNRTVLGLCRLKLNVKKSFPKALTCPRAASCTRCCQTRTQGQTKQTHTFLTCNSLVDVTAKQQEGAGTKDRSLRPSKLQPHSRQVASSPHSSECRDSAPFPVPFNEMRVRSRSSQPGGNPHGWFLSLERCWGLCLSSLSADLGSFLGQEDKTANTVPGPTVSSL